MNSNIAANKGSQEQLAKDLLNANEVAAGIKEIETKYANTEDRDESHE